MKSTEFIQTIAKIQWSDLSREDSEKLISENGFVLSFRTVLHADRLFVPSVQIVARLSYNGTLVTQWGFEDDDSQRAFIRFWNEAKDNTYTLGEQRDRANKAAARLILEGL